MRDTKWEVLNKTTDKGQLTTDKLINVLLVNRGIKTKREKEEFLNPKLDSVTIKSSKIDQVEVDKTVKRIQKAIKNTERVVVYGDYDVDGICGTAILWETLFESCENVMPYIPDRVDEGYGLSVAGIKNILDRGDKPGLIVTVDNGIVANEAVEFANKNKIDVIITDHHVASKKLPAAHSIVHTTKLCGAGVAYLLSKELSHESRIMNYKNDRHLELVALATVADLVPLIGNNRTLVKFGIESLKSTKRPGLLALFEEAQLKNEEIDVYKIGHIIAPRLNAAGRISSAMDSLRLVCTKDKSRAKKLAQGLGQTNRDRQSLTSESTEHADSVTVDLGKDKIIIVQDEIYNQGIIGLVASRLVEKYYRPSVVISVGAEISKGSARSVAGFNIIEFLRLHSDHMINAGGHPMAAGFTIETPKLEAFKKALIESSSKSIGDELLVRVLKIDLEVQFKNLNNNFYSEIQKLAPFGMGNPEPIFVSKDIRVESVRFVGKDNKHLKLTLSQNGVMFDAIYFSGGESGLKNGEIINVACTVEQDLWNGNEKIQLKIRDIRQN